ncbi:MAG: hypothetical protein ABI411_15340 [Tahibacter sp.]
MKSNLKIKALSVAVMGLAGVVYAGSSMAVCPTDPAAPAGPWTSKATLGGGALSITTPGLHTTECVLSAHFNAGAGGLASAFVRDDTPSAEPRFRFRFYTKVDAITPFSGLQKVQLFTANSAASFPVAGGSVQVLRASLIPGGGTGRQVSFVAGTNNGTDYVSAPFVAPLAVGENYVEGEVVIGAAGTGKVNIWVNNNVAGTPTGTINVDNAGWVGVDTAILGMADSTTSFRANQAAKDILFDEYDSRRQTFIGQ